MITVNCRPRKWGNSLGIIIPKEVSEKLGIREHASVPVAFGKPENPLKELYGAFKDWKVSPKQLKQWRRELESKYV
ncbi:MAG TPA: AbrB/MazE/SpoVT family DNA-binding domain-containing protein [Candidatus Nanoarchaeia archaeon]|nr:AbrB/MazE/SpoVT family DNA-binding domain-containing protein [Candidatus Nanoarchaeia archaeon]